MPSRLRPLLLAASAVSLLAPALPAAAATDPRSAEQWGLSTIGAPAAWSTGTGNGIVIAVLDTGADLAHEDLRTKLLPGHNFVDQASPPQDDEGHGSHVAGIAAAATGNGAGVAGVAPGASILPVKVLDSGGRGSVDDIAEAIRWAASKGAHVINLSLGPEIPILPSLLGTGLEDAVKEAWSRGSVVVVASGNTALFPSAYSDVDAIVVTATTREDRRAAYASGVGAAKWALSAPGGAGGRDKAADILSTYWEQGSPNAYGHLSGTSMATPFVAGAAAVLRGLGMSPQQTVDRLLATARDLGSPGRDSTFGSGRVDLAAAVGGQAPPAAASPTVPAAGSGPPPAPVTRTRPVPVPAPAPSSPAPAAVPGTGSPAPPATEVPATTGDQPGIAAPGGTGQERAPRRAVPGGDDRPWVPLAVASLAVAASAAALVRLRRGAAAA